MTKPSRLAFVGDVALHQEFPGTPQALGPALAEGVRSLVPEGTLLVANLEAPMTIVGQAFPGKCSLQSDPGWAQILRRAGVTAVSLANNHVMDSGPRGLEETLSPKRASSTPVRAGTYRKPDDPLSSISGICG